MNVKIQIFKKCPMCGLIWNTRHDMLRDPLVKFTGYVENFKEPEFGIFTFNHLSCYGTFAVRASCFTDFPLAEIISHRTNGALHNTRFDQSKSRPGCPQQFEYAYLTDCIQQIKELPEMIK